MNKKIKLGYVKQIDSEKKRVDAYVSTFEWDRQDERFIKGAWNLEAFKKNPVVLWSHNTAQLPIGKNVEMIEDDHGLLATTEFDQKGEQAMQVFSLFERGFLNAFSVGFMLKDYVMEQRDENRKGLAITNAELYEYSAVSVPANPGALVSRETAELVVKTLGNDAIVPLTGRDDEFFMVPRIPKTDDLSGVLKQMIGLAKTAKGTKELASKRSLILTAASVFNEILGEEKEELNIEELKKLQGGLTEFASVAALVHPEAETAIAKLILQVDKAVTGKA